MWSDRGVHERRPRPRWLVSALVLGVGLTGGLAHPGMVQAATQTVTNCSTDGTATQPGTLRHAITTANPSDTITFACSGTIPLSPADGGTLAISKNMTLDGSRRSVTISGEKSVGVFSVSGGVTVHIIHLTVANGSVSGFFSGGGGIANSGTLTLSNSTVSGNTATGTSAFGGGIANSGTLTVTNSTISGNTADNGGGGVYNEGGTLTVTNSTISGNSAFFFGGGVWNSGILTVTNSTMSGNSAYFSGGGLLNLGVGPGRVTLTNSTLSGNSAPLSGGIENALGTVTLGGTIVAKQTLGPDCNGTVISQGYNLDSDGSCNLTQPSDKPRTDPLLGPLQNNGGPTQTQEPGAGSPAIDGGGSSCPVTDQRGVPRPQGPACDIGAVEVVQLRAGNNGPVVVGQPVTITISNVNTGHPPALLYALDCSGSGSYLLTSSGGTSPSGTCTFGQIGQHVVRVVVELASDRTIVGTAETTVGVTKAGTTTRLTSSANPSASGQPVSFLATVSPTPPASGTPTGSIQFFIDGEPFGSPVSLSGGRATSQSTSSLAPGSHSITATYSGDANSTGSRGSLTQTVNQANRGITIPAQSSKGVTVEAFGTSSCTSVASSTKVSTSGSPSGTFAFRDERPGGSPCGAYRAGVITLQALDIDAVVCTSHSTASIHGGAREGTYPSSNASTVTFQTDVAITSASGTFNGTVSVQTSSGYSSGAVPTMVRITGC